MSSVQSVCVWHVMCVWMWLLLLPASSWRWHSKRILRGLRGEMSPRHTPTLSRSCSHIYTNTHILHRDKRALEEHHSHGDWVTAELDLSCGNQHLLLDKHSHTRRHTHTHVSLLDTADELGHTLRWCGMYTHSHTHTLQQMLINKHTDMNRCRRTPRSARTQRTKEKKKHHLSSQE